MTGSRRLGALVGGAATAALLVACGSSTHSGSTSQQPGPNGTSGGSSSSNQTPTQLVAASLPKTEQAKTAGIEFTDALAVSGQNVTVQGTGSIDFAGKRSQLLATSSKTGQVEERTLDGVFYVQVPPAAASQFGGKSWIKIDPSATGGSNPLAGVTSTANPSTLLQTLRGAGNVTKVGDEPVRGVPTTHFHADVDPVKAAEQAGLDPKAKQQLQQLLGSQTVPEDVWIDEQGLVRRLKATVNANAPTGGSTTPVSSAFSAEFFDYGRTVTVSAPPADQVADLSQLLGQLPGSAAPSTTPS